MAAGPNTDEDVNTISYLQDLHANFVRLAHYPHDERMERAPGLYIKSRMS